MLSESVLRALTFQMQQEQTNSQIYRLFSSIADFQGLVGATSWFKKQSLEETEHFECISTYIQDQGHIITLLQIPEQTNQIVPLYDMFVKTLELEKETTRTLKLLAEICKEERDDQTFDFILKMLKEQIQEEKVASDILGRINLVGSGIGTILIDQELAKR